MRSPPVTGRAGGAGTTRAALLQAAGEVFASVGFRHATVRQICERAGANVAAINYHFGDKSGLYAEVLRAVYREGLAQYPERHPAGAAAPPAARLAVFVRSLLFRLLAHGPASWHGKLLAMEMIDPTPALDLLVTERIAPMADELREIVTGLLGPPAPAEVVRWCGSSIVSQCLFYRHCHSVLHRLFPDQGFGPADIEALATHITRFSLAALHQYARPVSLPRPARPSRAPAPRRTSSSPPATFPRSPRPGARTRDPAGGAASASPSRSQ